jgi:uncharacterized protein
MVIRYDAEKRQRTLDERGLDFLDALSVINDAVAVFEDERFDYPEQRMVTYGMLDDRLVVVVWTEIEDGYRVISMRKANDREQRLYQG